LAQPIARPVLVFKKPTRYVGKRSSDAVEPIRLGGKPKTRRSSKRKGKSWKGPGKSQVLGGKVGKKIVEQEDVLEDGIEDE